MSRYQKVNSKGSTYSKARYSKIDRGRAEGDKWFYYFAHSFFSMVIFLIIAIPMNFFILKEDSISYLFSLDFLLSIVIIFSLSILISIISRVFVYYIILKKVYKAETRTIWELNFNKGINKIGLRFILAVFFNTIVFCTGAVWVLQQKWFGDDGLKSLILTYLIVKVVIMIISTILAKSKG